MDGPGPKFWLGPSEMIYAKDSFNIVAVGEKVLCLRLE